MKKKILLISILFLIVLFSAGLYHNDNFYLKFREKINPRLTQIVDLDFLKTVNNLANFFDFKGKIKTLQEPLEKENFIDFKINFQEEEKLENYLKTKPVKKKWIKIKLLDENKYIDAKIKFHGTDLKHYNNKNSYTIKLATDSKYFFKKFKLIKGEEFDPTIISINKIANKYGLISSFGKMVVLRINGKDKGHYYFVQDTSEDFLSDKYGIKKYVMIAHASNTYARKEGKIASHISDNDLCFAHIKQTKDPLFSKGLNKYKTLTEKILNNEIKEVKKKFDLDYMAKYLAIAALFNDVHFMLGDNLKMIYDFDKEKFFPIFRIESSGVPILRDYKNKFPLFNKFLFDSYGHKSYSDALSLKLFKLLLSDNDLRNKRDFYFNEFFLKKDSLINDIKITHAKNEKIMIHYSSSRREYDLKKKRQIHNLKSLLKIGREYLKYGHAYISCDTSSKKIYMLLDSFSPLDIYENNNAFKMEKINGIELDSNLHPIYNYKTVNIKDYSFNANDLIIINHITKDTLKKNIYINYIVGL